ncbi:HAD family hydrolase [Streptomyces virginiae]|uniref:HAD family hydrolase n=1 Tax=Streptomyces virginiae TaxID=1961 RepID=UPI00331E9A38
MPTRADSLGAALSPSKAVLFDFDGPICDVFQGLSAPGIAHELANLLAVLAPALDAAARATDDPMEVHRLSQEAGLTVLAAVEAALTAAEVRAVQMAGDPTSGAIEALTAARSSGRRVAIVSNNSSECVRQYLALHKITALVDEVIGRPTLRPDLMKPSPHPLLSAATAFALAPSSTVLIGDSVTDVEAALAAGARCIGYANKPRKLESLTTAGADAVVVSMHPLALALTADGGRE